MVTIKPDQDGIGKSEQNIIISWNFVATNLYLFEAFPSTTNINKGSRQCFAIL